MTKTYRIRPNVSGINEGCDGRARNPRDGNLLVLHSVRNSRTLVY